MKRSLFIFTIGMFAFIFIMLTTLRSSVLANDERLPEEIFMRKAVSQEAAVGEISLDDYVDDETRMADLLGNCRYGASQLGGEADNEFISEMNLGWKNNFNVSFANAGSDSAHYAPTVRIEQIEDNDTDNTNDDYEVEIFPLDDSVIGLGPQVRQNPGSLWLIGNEPDRDVIQDALYPQVYARAYHDIYYFIKQRDPSADIAIAGLVQVSQNRLEYLTIVWDTYQQLYGEQMPVDVWNMHAYAFPERTFNNENIYAWIALGTNPDSALYYSQGNATLCGRADVRCIADHDDIALLRKQITDMRTWMKQRGQQQKPLIISEYGLLYPYEQDTPTQCFIQDEFGNCFTEQRNIDFAKRSFSLLESYTSSNLGYAIDGNRMVQQWLWFGTRASSVEKFALVNQAGTELTGVGKAFRDHIQTKPLVRNLLIHSFSAPAVNLSGSTATGKVNLKVVNNGTQAIVGPVRVTLYSDAGLTNEIDTVLLENGVRGCATDFALTQLEWRNLPQGKHNFWVKIDSANQYSETSESDNVISGTIFVGQPTLYLPIIRR